MQSSSFYTEMDDKSLWSHVLHGEMKALAVLYERHYELLLNFGLKYCNSEEFVKDCIQDVFVKICTSKRLSHTEYVRSYFLTSLKNMIYDKLALTHLSYELDEHLFELQIEDSGLQFLFKDNDEALRMSRQFVKAYRGLRGKRPMAIYLRYVKGLSYQEIAEVLHINQQSSMNLVSRALASLRSGMDPKYLPVIITMLGISSK